MYIKMNDDKSLTITVRSTFYQGDKNADSITFLIPVACPIDIAACDISMHCIMPNRAPCVAPLALQDERYKDHYQYILPVTECLTVQAGTIEAWVVAKDEDDHIVLRTGSVYFEVRPNPAYLPQLGSGDASPDDVIYF